MKTRFALNRPGIWILVAVIVSGAGAWQWQSRRTSPKSFRTTLVKRGALATVISATGTIEPIEVVDVGTQVAGQIRHFGKDKAGKTVDYGSVVEQGSVLAKIDDSVYTAELAVARAQFEQASAGELSAAANLEQMRAKVAQTEGEWKRAAELQQSKVLSKSDYDLAQVNYEVAKANVSAAKASVAQAKANIVQAQAAVAKAQRNLALCTIMSPVNGVVIDRRVNIGQTVVASLNAPSLFLIAKDLTRMQIWVGVNEADVGRIVPGAPVTFTCDAFPGKEFNGSVGKVRLNATMTQNVVMYTVEVNTENPGGILLPYLTANVHFVTQEESNSLLVPNAALRWTPSASVEISPAVPPPKADRSDDSARAAGRDNPERLVKSRRGTLWLRDGTFVQPLEVMVKASDGVNTAVASESLREGQIVVIGEDTQAAQSTTENPFIPKVPKR